MLKSDFGKGLLKVGFIGVCFLGVADGDWVGLTISMFFAIIWE